MEDVSSQILHVSLNKGVRLSKLRWHRLAEWVRRFLGMHDSGSQFGDVLFHVTQARLERLTNGFPLSLQEASQTLGYAERALDLVPDSERRAMLHFWMAQLGALRSRILARASLRELRLAHSHLVQAEQLGLREARSWGHQIWQLLKNEQSCPISEHNPQEEPAAPERISLATPYLEQGRIALQAYDLPQAQAAFARAREVAPFDLQCEDRWLAVSFLLQAQSAIEASLRPRALRYLTDGVRFHQPFATQTEQPSWSQAIRRLAEQGDLLQELATTYRNIADEQLLQWLNHYMPEEGHSPSVPKPLLRSFEEAALHYSYALGNPYTAIDLALDHYNDVMQKLTSLYWHGEDYASVVNACQQILSYLPQRRQQESAYFHSVLAHAYVAMSRHSSEEEAQSSLADRAREHATRAIREDPETEMRHHLSEGELMEPPAADYQLCGGVD